MTASPSRAEPSFSKAPTPPLQMIAEGLEFPEGPIALNDGSFLVVEIKGGRLTRIAPDGTLSTVAEVGGGPNGAALGPDGACYIANNGGHRWRTTALGPVPAGIPDSYEGGRIQRVDLATGTVETLYADHQNGKLTSPNDLVFDAFGGMWFTDLGLREPRSMHFGSVCYALADGSHIEEVIHPLISPNGIALSPAGDRLYVPETHTGRVWAFDIVGPGKIAKKPWPSPNGGELVCNLGGFRLPDSMAVDSEGHLHVATMMDPGIARISPNGDTIVHTYFPDLYTTNICFGNSDMKTAYVTQTQTGKLFAFDCECAGLKLHYSL